MECRVIRHFGRQGTKQIPDALLHNIHVIVPHHHDAPLGANALLATAKFSQGHVAFHDVYAVLLIEGNTGHLSKHTTSEWQTRPLSVGIVDKHLCYRCLPAGDMMGIRRNLLKR